MKADAEWESLTAKVEGREEAYKDVHVAAIIAAVDDIPEDLSAQIVCLRGAREMTCGSWLVLAERFSPDGDMSSRWPQSWTPAPSSLLTQHEEECTLRLWLAASMSIWAEICLPRRRR